MMKYKKQIHPELTHIAKGVYFPDYHLTPKYPYPAAYDDVLALYKCIILKNAFYFEERVQ